MRFIQSFPRLLTKVQEIAGPQRNINAPAKASFAGTLQWPRERPSPQFGAPVAYNELDGPVSDNALQMIDYHAVRAIEELERAECTKTDVERSSHMELSRLHLCQAGWLRAAHNLKSR